MASANPFDSAMRHFKQVLLSSVLSICAFAANAQQVPTPSGIWVTYDDHTGAATSEVKVTESEAGLTGVIDKILDPLKAQAKCTLCEDERKDQPIQGMVFFRNVKVSTEAPLTWDHGEILDPKSGKTYKVRIKLLDNGQTLEVRGYKGSIFFGRTQVWKRLEQQ